MKYIYGKRLKSFRKKLTSFVAAAAILSNSVGVALPVLLTQRAAAAETNSVSAVAKTANSVTLKITAHNFQYGGLPFSIRTDGNDATKQSFYLPESSFNNPDHSFTLPNPRIADEYVEFSFDILNQSPNPPTHFWDHKLYVAEPTLSFVANYLSTTDYHGISVEIKTPNLTDATGIEVKVNRTNGSPDVWISNPANTNATGGLNGPSHGTTAPIVIVEGTRTRTSSGSWQTTGSPWNNTQEPTSVTVRVNRSGGATPLEKTVSLIGSTWGTTWADIEALMPTVPATPQNVTVTAIPSNVSIANNGYTTTDKFRVDWEAGDSNPVDHYLYKTWAVTDSTTPHNSEATAFTDSTLTSPTRNAFTNAGEGAYYIRIAACDSANNCSDFSAAYIINYDVTAPNISWQKQPLPIYGSGAGFHVRPITSEVGTTKSVYIDSVSPENLVWTLTSDHKNFDTKNINNQTLWDSLSEGTHKFVAVFEDYAGNSTTSESRSFIIDHTGPTITVKTGTSYTVGTDPIFSKVSFSLFDAHKVDKVTINGVVKDLSDNNWSDVNFVKPGTFGAVEGTNTIVAYDAAGNTTTYVFTLDTNSPDAPTLVSPENGAFVNGATIVQTWTTSNTDISYFIYESYNDDAATSLRWNDVYTSPSKSAINVSESTYWWRVKAVDFAGNVSGWSDLWKITVDNTAPTGVVTYSTESPTSGNIFAYLTTSEPVKDIGGNWERRGPDSFRKAYPVNNHLPNWDQTVAFEDLAGNTGSAHVYIDWMDNVAPTVPEVTSPLAGDIFNGGSTVNSWTTSTDTHGVVEYEVKYEFVGRPTDYRYTNSTSRTQGFTGSYQGPITISVRARDAASNWSAFGTPVTYFYDSTAPAVNIPSYATLGNVITPTVVTDDADEPLTFAWTPSDTNPANGVEISDPTVKQPNFTVNTDGNYSFTLTTTDNAGNPTVKVFSFTYITPTPEEEEEEETVAPVQTPVDNTPTTGGGFTNVATGDVLGVNTDTPSEAEDSSKVLAQADDQSNNGNNSATGDTEGEEAKACAKWLGICWYWWIPIVIVILGTVYYVSTRRAEEK